MASARTDLSLKYRTARARLSALETLRDTLERSRPRTRGKKAARTRALNKLKRQIPAAKGLLTKARKVIDRAKTPQNVESGSAFQKRSDAAKRGWAKRRANASGSVAWATWLHLLPDGSLTTITLDKTDSTLEGMYWNAHGDTLAGKRGLWEFEGISVFDIERQREYPFVTDLDVIAESADSIDFGPGFYKRRNESPGGGA
jgi:hypothetical protein